MFKIKSKSLKLINNVISIKPNKNELYLSNGLNLFNNDNKLIFSNLKTHSKNKSFDVELKQ